MPNKESYLWTKKRQIKKLEKEANKEIVSLIVLKNNYDSINWKIEKDKVLIKKELKNKDGSVRYIYE